MLEEVRIRRFYVVLNASLFEIRSVKLIYKSKKGFSIIDNSMGIIY